MKIDTNFDKLKTKFFKFFVPEKCYIRYQLNKPYYQQAPSKQRLLEIYKEYKNQNRKINVYEVWYNTPPLTKEKIFKIEEIISRLCRENSNGKFLNGISLYIQSGEKDECYVYIKETSYKNIRASRQSREEALLKLCLDESIRNFIKEDIRRLFCE